MLTADEIRLPMDERIAELLVALNTAMNDELDVISRFVDQPNCPSHGRERASTEQPSPTGAVDEEKLNLVKP